MPKTILFFYVSILLFVICLGGVAALRSLIRRVFRGNEKGEYLFYAVGVIVVFALWLGWGLCRGRRPHGNHIWILRR